MLWVFTRLALINAFLQQTFSTDKLGSINIIFTLIIGTPFQLTILVLKFEIVHSTTC